ncbi:MAG: LPS export ABC transporter ATP-binding protein [Planctomycetes bacterium]|nr:LPS export ABC transporter ATP-binding protein [Planctomycetota bacterium]
MKLLEVVGLEKSFGKRKVVDQVNIEVFSGEVVGLLGPNGAGKTTSFRIIMGMMRGDGGQVFFRGHNITSHPMYKRARLGMGYLSQAPSVFQRLTVRENLLAILETLKMPRRQRRSEAERILAEMELTRVADSKAYTLSGGEKRRLEIARALITRPSLLMLDEPFSGVDPKAVYEIQGIILDLRKNGIGVLLTDHSVRETLAITDRAYIIHEGRVLVSGTAEKLISDPEVRRVYLGEAFQTDGISYVPPEQVAGRSVTRKPVPSAEEDLDTLVAGAVKADIERKIRRGIAESESAGARDDA